jgi:hypothetical protein
VNMLDTLERMTYLVNAAQELAKALDAARDGLSDDEWDALCDNPLVDAVLSAAMEVEDHVM